MNLFVKVLLNFFAEVAEPVVIHSPIDQTIATGISIGLSDIEIGGSRYDRVEESAIGR